MDSHTVTTNVIRSLVLLVTLYILIAYHFLTNRPFLKWLVFISFSKNDVKKA